jgi:hypothetical protein
MKEAAIFDRSPAQTGEQRDFCDTQMNSINVDIKKLI